VGIATLGYLATKILKNPLDQFIILYLIVIISFLLAEHFHIAGILSIVASVLTFKTFILQNIKDSHHHIEESLNEKLSLLEQIKNITAITKKGFKEYQKEAMFIGIFANGIVFIIISNIINIEALKTYYVEILTIFALTSVIRFIAVLGLTKSMKLPQRWAYTLTFAGSKGALAIIMSHSLPHDFIYREMFIAIVIGVVLLSTFIYTIILMYHIASSQSHYIQDIRIYDNDESNQNLAISYKKDLINILEKEQITNAYNSSFFEDILNKEISRAQRYKTDLSILIFKIQNKHNKTHNLKTVGEIINKKIRVNDYFGKLSDDKYMILTSNTSLSGAVVLAEKTILKTDKIQNLHLYFGVTQMDDTDTIDSIYEKLEDALTRALDESGERVEIEI
jgi:CPA1 family monovalent cation:H+ antiporter